MTITGTYDVGDQDDPALNQFAEDWMTGILGGICNASITNELTSLYTSDAAACTGSKAPWNCCTAKGVGATYTAVGNSVCTNSGQPYQCCTGSGIGNCNLFQLIAQKESSYAQFALITANGVYALWPTESPVSSQAPIHGEYIGLMQVALRKAQGNACNCPMSTAWSWLSNTQTAQTIFNQKLASIGTVNAKAQVQETKYPNLPMLTQQQAETYGCLAIWRLCWRNEAGSAIPYASTFQWKLDMASEY